MIELLVCVIVVAGFCSMTFTTAVKAAAAEKVVFELYDPTGGFEVTQLHAPRLDSLHGKTICELSDDSWQAHRTFPAVRELLQRMYPTAKMIPYTEFPVGTGEIDTAKAADIVKKKGCQAVIVGNAG